MIVMGEAVLRGHPDKVADQISDSIVDSFLINDPDATIACDVLIKGNTVVVAGEVGSQHIVSSGDYDAIIRRAVYETEIMKEYTEKYGSFEVINLVSPQSPHLRGIAKSYKAADQGIVRGACYATKTGLPLVHELALNLAYFINEAKPNELGPDGKCLIVCEIDDDHPNEIMFTQLLHVSISIPMPDLSWVDKTKEYMHTGLDMLWGRKYPSIMSKKTKVSINPPDGVFIGGGPAIDAGLTGRKQAVDSYGLYISTGGGAFSGKDPSKIDRTMAYGTRWAAKSILNMFPVEAVYVDASFEMGDEFPSGFQVTTVPPVKKSVSFNHFKKELSVKGLIDRFNLKHPETWKYEETAMCGHFGDESFPWEIV